MRRRFFVPQFDSRRATLSGDSAHHLARVLRASPGQLYELSDGAALWLARIEHVSKSSVEFSLVEPLPARAPSLHLTLLLSIVKFDRFEWAIEKATELGVTEIIPLAAARSEKPLLHAAPKRAARWQKILLESAQQSRRLAPPVLHPLARPADAFTAATSDVGATRNSSRAESREGRPLSSVVPVLLSERPDAPSLRDVLSQANTAFPKPGVPEGTPLHTPSFHHASLAIGPEGGWTDDELSAAQRAGFLEASLGPTILRTETAVTASLAILSFALSTPSP